MEHMIQLHIEKLPEGVYLATSDEVQGLVAQGRTIQETIEIARDIAEKLIKVQAGSGELRIPRARRPMGDVLCKFAKFSPDFMDSGRLSEED